MSLTIQRARRVRMRALITLGTTCVLASVPALALEATGPANSELVARYETRITTPRAGVRIERWSFTRSTNAVEYRWLDRDISEHWRRDSRANVSHERIYHREATRVRYSAGDLAALGIDAQWNKLDHVIVPPHQSGLTAAAAATKLFGHPARRFTSARTPTADGTRLVVTWLEDLALPAEVRSIGKGGDRSVVRLLELASTPPRATHLQTYRQLDFSDFGDMTYDPFVRKHFAHPGH
jgi:hypothetical protein